jgi:hypothetical protein
MELFMYPSRSHGIQDPGEHMVKALSEMAWMDHSVLGIGDKCECKQVLKTLGDEAEGEREEPEGG